MPATRTVKRLHLKGPSEASLRHAALTLEDALRVASLPDRAGCLLLVRHLRLPGIAPDASPQTLALALEQAVDGSRARWVHGASAQAGRSIAVWFADALEAHLVAARRVLERRALVEWFWPLAIPAVGDGWPGADVPSALRRLALSLASLPEAPVALPRWTAILVEEGAAPTLREALQRADVPVLARAAELTRGPAAGRRPGSREIHTPRRRRDAPGPEGGAAFAVPPHVDRPLHQPRAAGDAPVGTRPGGGARGPDLAGDPHRGAVTGMAGEVGQPGQVARTLRGAPSMPDPLERDAGRSGPEIEAVPESRSFGGMDQILGLPTAAGGLLFLVAVLRRLRYPDWLEDHPEWVGHQVARRLFVRLLEGMELPPLDPAWSLAESTTRQSRAVPGRFVAPAAWAELCGDGVALEHEDSGVGWLRDPSDRLLLGAWKGPRPRQLLPALKSAVRKSSAPKSAVARSPVGKSAPRRGGDGGFWRDPALRADAVAGAWRTACRRWVRRHVGMGLADLVGRPARLALTATHADVTLDLRSVDLRVRRTGVDLDPGWVPWLGRVVGFHYEVGVEVGGDAGVGDAVADPPVDTLGDGTGRGGRDGGG